ncbi:ACON-3 protein [Pleurostoma richardsiae]|uniref:ACON-3 protein n=1 Tax=Pleurostoma richardsiae TaxID=41990 RepID=A0AA38VK64_9PEZI|nr:ACON-3 protein [Pleurostoma richardsiae]
MSAAGKFESPLYKLFEPGYPPPRPIIVDEAIESPETVTLRYEEEAAARGNGAGGEFRGDSPSLLPMSAYKPQQPQLHGFTESPYSQYSPQSFASQQTENAASQMNQMAFAANNAAAVAANAQYMVAPASGVSVLGSQPASGTRGTKVFLRISSAYDFSTVTSTQIYATVSFGEQRTPASIAKIAQDSSGMCTYRVVADTPQLLVTPGHQGPVDVPLGLIISSEDGNEIARVDAAGQFTYQDSAGEDESSAHDRSVSPKEHRSPELAGPDQGHQHPRESPPHLTLRTGGETTSPSHQEHAPQMPLPGSEGTNTYGYSPAAVQQAQDNFAATAAAYSQGNNNGNNMLHAYRTSSFSASDHYHRGASALRSPHGIGGWTTYGGGTGGHVDTRTPTLHTSIGRSSLATPLPVPVSGNPSPTPRLVRTTTISSSTPGMGPSGYHNPWAVSYGQPQRAQLHINGDLDSMAQDWTQEEWDNRRRIVMFKRSQTGHKLTVSFRAVSVNDRPPGGIYVSCIWWAERGECFVTSVDTIHLLEQLLMTAHQPRFPVEEKNRIRRNLEGFKPLTVSKAKADTEEFFKVIMGFGNPKPRNIEKDVKVFPWKILGQALKKIISKYSASSNAGAPMPPSMPPATPTHLLTPVSLSGGAGSYVLPPTPGPGSSTTATDPTSATGYISAAQHAADSSIPSPRSLSGTVVAPSSTSWGSSYPGLTTRTLSPVGLVKPQTPTPTSSLRISTLPSAYDTRGSGPSSSVPSPYGLPAMNHHGGTSSSSSHLYQHGHHNHQGGHHVPASQSHAARWDYSVGSAADTGGYGGHGAHSASVYGGAYGEGAQRA